MFKEKFSKQRKIILDNLRSRKDHPTADMVFESVKQDIPNISLGTVYRNLAYLTATNQIMQIACSSGKYHYDGTAACHYHLYCEECNSVLDIDMPTMPALDFMASSAVNCKINGHSVLFTGICENCLNQK